MKITSDELIRACRHLRRKDAVLAPVVDRVGPIQLKLHRNYFQSLAKSIIFQQISTAAGRTIWGRLQQQMPSRHWNARELGAITESQFKTAGVSKQKSSYLRDLAGKVNGGRIPLRKFSRMSDEQVVASLVQIHGVGDWTAQMFLIFSLGRPNVFPLADLGIRSAIKRLYALGDLPDKPTSLSIAAPWRPWCTVASWYLWRSLELPDDS